ncbi:MULTISPECIES: nucleotide exchange factor GrpE [unclassified Coleofasciculus]|uniref:nucleotide exchange factor GrpE n=1 Tax=unclassified Coleofasciculus TaxID=2692782 RepID=UPI00188177DF|nr:MULTISPECIES: nucleotide exchange factor GrpE [unclassified Coleofasciculus]MBE9127635.1 nucleotide exchange factor GrpE [Coleofasciculus sp. LEGE 07081]MBE9150980.1 nucleotide exchange factor GrpE [Coleofasciculus sp. LEGE 07092]
MSDEEKQPDNTMQQTDESAATGVEATMPMDSELPLNEDQATAEVSPETTTTEEENSDVEIAEAATDVSVADSDLAVLETLKQENEALKAQIEELNQQFDAFKTQSIRIAADFDNFRKRTAKEKEELDYQIKKVTLSELLPVVDNFERARSQIKPQNDGEMTIHKSYQGVYKQLVECLKRIGVSPMRPEGQEFDPNFHEAVMRESTNEYPEGTVIEQLMRGYFLNERVLRHAMVKVAAAGEPVVTSEEETQETPES